MCERAKDRKAFGKYLHEHGSVSEDIARSRIEIDEARLLVLRAAWLFDTVGAINARKDISMIKALVPSMQTRVADRAIQVFGAMGVSPDTPSRTSTRRGGRYASRTDPTRFICG
jgi:acyl-CoA dehydrogenase